MTTDENEIKYSERYDGQSNINLRDHVSEALIKVYPYRAVYGGKDKTIIQVNTKTIVRISQTGIDDFELANMKEDEGTGDKYIEIFAVIDSDTKKTISSGTSTFIQDVRKIKTFTAITNNYIESTSDKPDFFTIGEPFNKEKADSGEQIIYYGSSFTPSYMATKREVAEAYDVEDESRMAEIVLQDISQLEEQFSNSKLSFRIKSLPLDNVSNITIKTLPNILIDKVKVKGISSEVEDSELLDIDFNTTSNGLSWFNAIPITTKDKIEITTPWFDENITLGKSMIETILLTQGKEGLSWTSFCTSNGISVDLKNLVLDMVLYSYEYNNTFGDVPRTDSGAMVKKYRIGTAKTRVSSVANTTPKNTITGLYKKWKKIHTFEVGGKKEKIVKSFIAAISQEINSELSVAGGGNDFNKNVLPWRVVLSQNLVIDIDDRNDEKPDPDHPIEEKDKEGWINLKDFKFKVDFDETTIDGVTTRTTPYFNLENNTFTNFNSLDLSESKFVESERRIILPELPETISAIDKINNVGDFSTTSSKDLKYMLKIPLADDEVNLLWEGTQGEQGKKTIVWSNDTLGEKFNAWTQAAATEKIREQILTSYSDATDIKAVTTSEGEVKYGKNEKINSRDEYTIAASFTQDKFGWWIFSGYNSKNTGEKAGKDDEFNKYIKGTIPDNVVIEIEAELGNDIWVKSLHGGKLLNDYQIFFPYSKGSQAWFGREVNGAGSGGGISGGGLNGPESGFVGGTGSNQTDVRKRIFQYLIKDKYKIDDIDDIVIDVFELPSSSRQGRNGWTKFTYAFHIIRNDWSEYEYTFTTNLPSKELVERQTIYDRPKWKQLIKRIINPQKNGIKRKIFLSEKYDVGPYELREITFSSMFGDKIWIDFSNGDELEIKLNQRQDETISTTRIVFY